MDKFVKLIYFNINCNIFKLFFIIFYIPPVPCDIISVVRVYPMSYIVHALCLQQYPVNWYIINMMRLWINLAQTSFFPIAFILYSFWHVVGGGWCLINVGSVNINKNNCYLILRVTCQFLAIEKKMSFICSHKIKLSQVTEIWWGVLIKLKDKRIVIYNEYKKE